MIKEEDDSANINIEKNNDDWETDEDDGDVQFYRVHIDHAKKIKQSTSKWRKLKRKKFKKLDKDEFKSLMNMDDFYAHEIYPKITIDPQFNKTEILSMIKFGEDKYNIHLRPEVGTNLIFELGKSGLSYIGKSTHLYEATTMQAKSSRPGVHKPKQEPKNNYNSKTKLLLKKRKRSKLKTANVQAENKNIKDKVIQKSSNKRQEKISKMRRRKRNAARRYKKESTTIEVKKI